MGNFEFSCHKCTAPKRHPGCHATCPEYTKEKAAHDQRKAEIYKELAPLKSAYEQRTEAVAKARRRHRTYR